MKCRITLRDETTFAGSASNPIQNKQGEIEGTKFTTTTVQCTKLAIHRNMCLLSRYQRHKRTYASSQFATRGYDEFILHIVSTPLQWSVYTITETSLRYEGSHKLDYRLSCRQQWRTFSKTLVIFFKK